MGAILPLVENIKPIREFLCTFSSCSVLGIYMIYNILSFRKKRTKNGSLFTSLTSLTIKFGESYLVPPQRRLTLGSRTSYLANDDQRLAAPSLQGVEVVGEKIWVPGGEGFGTEKITYGGSDTFAYKFKKIQIPIRNFFFLGTTLQLVENIKPIR